MGMYEKISEYYKKIATIKQIEGLLDWDMNVYLPAAGFKSRGEQAAYLAEEKHAILTDEKFTGLVGEIFASSEYQSLTPTQQHELMFIKRQVELERKIPASLITELAKESAVATGAWENAKETGDDREYLKHLEIIFDLVSQYASCKGYESDPYDALLDDYDRGLTYKNVERIFGTLRRDLNEVINSADATVVDNSFLLRSVEESVQQAISEKIIDILGIDRNTFALNESTHPFTSTQGIGDVRITTRYFRKNFTSSIFSTLHEAGHALYELGVQRAFGESPCGELVSLSLHESQSRFYENVIGRSSLFCEFFFPEIQKIAAPVLDNVYPYDFYYAINKIAYTPIRIESDEVYYNLHILLRTQIEHDLINKKHKVKEINELWNAYFKEFFGHEIADKRDGYIQDIHWAGGGIGYFPTYTMGNIIAAQMAGTIHKNTKLLDEVTPDLFVNLGEWFAEHFYCYGNTLTSSELVAKVTGEEIDPHYLVDYLKRKVCSGL